MPPPRAGVVNRSDSRERFVLVRQQLQAFPFRPRLKNASPADLRRAGGTACAAHRSSFPTPPAQHFPHVSPATCDRRPAPRHDRGSASRLARYAAATPALTRGVPLATKSIPTRQSAANRRSPSQSSAATPTALVEFLPNARRKTT